MSAIFDLLKFKQLNAASSLERSGDLFLAPVRKIFHGHRFVVFQAGTRLEVNSSYGISSIEKSNRTVSKILAICGLSLFPVGFSLKVISLLNQSTYKAYASQGSIELLTEDNITLDIYFSIVKHSKVFLKYEPKNFFEAASYTFLPLGLSECACLTDMFDRFKNPHRNQIEDKLIEDLHEHKSNKRIKILSLGYGYLLPEFMLIGKLLADGHKKITVYLIDPNGNQDAVVRLQGFYQKLNADVQLKIVDNSEQYTQRYHEVLDAIYAVDYDNFANAAASKELHNSRLHLKEYGKTYLGYYGAFVLNCQNKLKNLNDKGFISLVTRSFSDHIKTKNKDTLSLGLACNSPIALPFFMAAIAWAVKEGYRNLNISFLSDDELVQDEFLENSIQAIKDWMNIHKKRIKLKIKCKKKTYDILGPRYFEPEVDRISVDLLRKKITAAGASFTFSPAYCGYHMQIITPKQNLHSNWKD